MHPNLGLLSHSSNVLLHKCPRKFELYKLSNANTWQSELAEINNHEELSNLPNKEVHLDFGTILGNGTQEYLVSNSENQAVMEMLKKWPNNIEDDSGEKDKKTFWHALYGLDKFVGQRVTAFSNLELSTFNGRPAVELGFIIDCGSGFTYRGKLDALLIDKKRKELVPYEGKTSKSWSLHEAMFRHSGQALGYSIIVDTIARTLDLPYTSSFRVLYNCYKTTQLDWEHFFFPKSHLQRALWIKSLLMDCSDVQRYDEQGYFPLRGENCYSFFRPCEHFGTCEMSNEVLVPNPVVKVDKPEDYTFRFTLAQLIDTQLAMQAMERL